MHFNSYDKILGETLFEAKVKAEKTYGKDNYSVITSKKVKHPIFFGLGHREMFEITIGIIKDIDKKNIITEIPSHPSPSIEVRAPSATSFMQEPNEPVVRKPKTASAAEKIKPVSHSLHGIRAYTSGSRPAGMRQVHGLRTNQEGNHEPQSQKVMDNDCVAPEQINDILDEIRAVKQTRQRLDKIANSARKQPVRTKAAELPVNTAQEANTMKAYEERLNEMFSLLQNMNKRFGQALEKEVPQIPEGLLHVKKSLLEIETPADVADEMVFELQNHLPQHALQHADEALQQTTSWLKQNLKFSSQNDFHSRQDGPRIVALIGPTGVGKTTTIAKIAASYGLNLKERLSIALFTLDTYRIGAADQLQQYAQIIDVDMEILYHTEDIDAAMQKHSDKDLIIVDTAGRCQKDDKELCELRNFLDHLPDSDKFLVLSATAKYTDMLETVHCFEKVGFEHLIFTKIDETNSFGPLLAVLVKTGKSLAYFTNGQRVPDDFCKASFDFFNSRLFPNFPKESDKGVFSQNSFYF